MSTTAINDGQAEGIQIQTFDKGEKYDLDELEDEESKTRELDRIKAEKADRRIYPV